MINLGDKVFQTAYDWGKIPDGNLKKYIVVGVSIDCYNHRVIACREVSNSKGVASYGEFIQHTLENTWTKVEDFRNNKIKQILS